VSEGVGLLRVGLVGLGRQMTQVLAPALAQIGGARIAAVCDTDPARLDCFSRVFAAPQRFESASAMLDAAELDAVLVAVGHDSNLPILEAALTAGVSAFVEKTPVASAGAAEQLASLQEETGRYVMAGFNRRFMDDFVELRRAVASPAFGEARLFQSQFHASRYDERAFLLNHVIHHLDLARFVLGEVEVRHVEHRRWAEREDAYAISFTTDSGVIGTIQAASSLDPRFPVERVEVVGLGGNVVVDELGYRWNRAPGTRTGADGPGWEPSAYRAQHVNLMGYAAELSHFLASVRAGARPTPDISDAAKTLRLVETVVAGVR